MYAVILTGGKQYRVSEGDVIEVEKLDVKENETVELEVLMTVDGENVVTGKDVTAKVTAVVLAHAIDSRLPVSRSKRSRKVTQ